MSCTSGAEIPSESGHNFVVETSVLNALLSSRSLLFDKDVYNLKRASLQWKFALHENQSEILTLLHLVV